MAQHDYVIANGTGAAVRSDINGALAAIVSQNSGATEPSPTYAYQPWADTSAGLFKIRNAANNAWITLYQLDGEWSTLAIENGSASAPSIYFKDSGTDTGIYSPGTDQVAISTGGTGRLFVDSSGRVGLGTSAPKEVIDSRGALVISGDNATSTNAFGTAEGVLLSTGTGVGRITAISNGNNNVDLSLRALNAGTATEGIRIKNDGKVGIGTNAPSQLLHLKKADATDAYTFYENSASSSYIGTTSLGDTYIYNTGAKAIRFLTNNSERAAIDSSGRLLVGTSTSVSVGTLEANQQIFGSTPQLSIIRGSNNASGPLLAFAKSRNTAIGSRTIVPEGDFLGSIRFCGDDGVNLDAIGAQIAGQVDGTPGAGDLPSRLVFSTCADGASSPTERMRIGQLGYTKISNAASYNNLSGEYHEFNGSAADWTAYVRNTNANPTGLVVRYSGAAPNGTGNQFLYCFDTGALRLEVRSNGGIANYSANNVNLSDRNAKKDISPATGTWDCLKEWEIVNFRYKDQPEDADLNMGVIAQQVAESCPEVITVFQEAKEATETEPAQEERLGVKDQQMVWMAIKALQEAQLRIETLEAEVAALKGA
jgi:hypothetical protein